MVPKYFFRYTNLKIFFPRKPCQYFCLFYFFKYITLDTEPKKYMQFWSKFHSFDLNLSSSGFKNARQRAGSSRGSACSCHTDSRRMVWLHTLSPVLTWDAYIHPFLILDNIFHLNKKFSANTDIWMPIINTGQMKIIWYIYIHIGYICIYDVYVYIYTYIRYICIYICKNSIYVGMGKKDLIWIIW